MTILDRWVAVTSAVITMILFEALPANAEHVDIQFRNPIVSASVPVHANSMLLAQLGDAITTRDFLGHRNTFERDPIAKPFVQSNLGAIGSAIVTNALLRIVFRHSQIAQDAITGIETLAVINNLRVIRR